MATQEAHVLVVSDDPARRVEVCAALDASGFRAVGLATTSDIAPQLDGGSVSAVLLDVSASCATGSEADEALARAVVSGRCPVVLFAEKSAEEIADVEGVTRLSIAWERGGRTLVGFLRRLLGRPQNSAPPREDQRPTRMPSRPDYPVRRRVLLVDDSEMTLDLVQAKLTDLGFDVRIAMSFAEVAPIATSFPPDVVVVNVKRPDVPVTRFCTALRAMARGAMVLLGSSMQDGSLEKLAGDAGVDGWASKRLGLEAYTAQIQAHVARRWPTERSSSQELLR